ncbi:ROK family transcriptional regulator [Actinomadura barringtoniae]|uniref:ROK family transcriptional regulator n=1 Tax=Actinomadura barringtoniae TaxID=1427535 RepID=A0A939PHD5_9ACTN|nr:ROK family transcriptional regulator [Actinomadura barringtoniae]MBO2449804.1 ROK family transcriptional regulator [Actinomadura barringtoniae]
MTVPTPGTPSLLRAINDRAALEVLLTQGPLTRPQLAGLTGISKPTASQLLARLEDAGLVLRDGVREGLPGRTAELYRVNPAAAYVAGLDVTPARIRAVAADLTGAVVGEHTLPTPSRSGVDAVARVRAALDAATAGIPRDRLRRVVIGIGGAVDPTTGRLGYAAHIPGWHVPDLGKLLTDALGTPVSIENDVNLSALAELAGGQAGDAGFARGEPTPHAPRTDFAGVKDFVLLWVADGVGMAVVLGGALHRGATGGAGEIGYMPVAGAPLMRDVRRTHTGGVHTLTGGSAVLKLMRAHGFGGRDPGTALSRAAAAAAGPGSAPEATGRAREALGELATRLGATLATVVAVLDPQLIVLTGEVLMAGGDALRELVERELHTMTIPRPPVRLSSIDGNPVLAGALHLALGETRDEVFSSTAP